MSADVKRWDGRKLSTAHSCTAISASDSACCMSRTRTMPSLLRNTRPRDPGSNSASGPWAA